MKLVICGPVNFDNDDELVEEVERKFIALGIKRLRHCSTMPGEIIVEASGKKKLTAKACSELREALGAQFTVDAIAASTTLAPLR